MKAVRLKTEHLFNPIGVDFSSPRLFWNCEGVIKQTAYQIITTDDSENILWDSGKTESDSMCVKWGGNPVPAKAKVLWQVRLWDETDSVGDWSKAEFETGIDTWKAKWITGNYKVHKNKRYPVDCFRKCFDTADVKKARLYITACGLYEAKLNGERVGNFILAPGITDYRKRIQYQTYDVTELLQKGNNILTVQLADGWYRGSVGAWGIRNQYGTETKLLAQLEITHADGRVQTIITDESWDWSNDGPIRFADNKDGEVVKANVIPTYSGKAKLTNHSVTPTASNNVPVTEHERLTAKLIHTPTGKTVLDFGQNIAGYAEFKLNAKAGQKIILRFGELLDENGEFTQKNIQLSKKDFVTPRQEVVYTCKEGENRYKTTFAIFGFQYILVETDVSFSENDFTAIALYSDMEQTGFFESSNELLNKFFENTVWSAKNNHADLPTDCPTRERHGWTGDAQIFCSTAGFLFDYLPFAEKYLNDIYDWQKKNGCLPQIAPEGGTDFYMSAMNGSVGWADAGVLIPYTMWKQYDDTEILKKYLIGMRRYAKYMQKRCGKWYPTAKLTGLHGEDRKYLSNAGQAYGEWAEPEIVHHMTWKDCAVPHPEVATAYTAHVMDCMAEIEMALGNKDESNEYKKFADNCRNSYQALRQTEAYTLDTDRQAQLVRPLAFKLLNEEQETYAKNRLITALEHFGWKLGTGFLSTPLILNVLTEIDLEAAYRLLENEEIPGWLSMPKNGATTIWEAWEGSNSTNGGIGSLNHYSKGAVVAWLFETMCGIRVKSENAFIIAPHPGGHFSYAKAIYDSVYGRVESAWEKTTNGLEYTITVPANCIAEVRLPNGQSHMQSAGTTNYVLRLEK